MKKTVKPNKDHVCSMCGGVIKKGEQCWSYGTRLTGNHYSHMQHEPRRSQCTDSEYLKLLYDIIDEYDKSEIMDFEEPIQCKIVVQRTINDFEWLAEHVFKNMTNVPGNLKKSVKFQALLDRYKKILNTINRLKCIDTDNVGFHLGDFMKVGNYEKVTRIAQEIERLMGELDE